jgi:hypothetical protein
VRLLVAPGPHERLHVQRLILAYAGEQNLVRTAQLSFRSPPFGGHVDRSLSAFDVDSAPLGVTPRAIPTLIAADDGGVFGQFIFDGTGVFPSTTSADNFETTSDRQAALEALVRVENPRDNSPDTIDCASCHMAPLRKPSLFDDTRNPMAFQPDGTNVTPSDMAATYGDFPPLFVHIHAFSYVDTAPDISQRVVNETAWVVEYLNRVPQ